MGTVVGRICDVAEDLKRVVEGDMGAVESPELVMGVLREMTGLDTSSWHDLLRELDVQAPDLRATMTEIRDKVDIEAIRLRIGTVGHRTSVQSNGRVLVDLELYSFGESPYQSRADFEDTLWVGMSVMRALAASIESALRSLNAPTMRNNVGDVFLKNLKDAEEQMSRVRELYDEITRTEQ